MMTLEMNPPRQDRQHPRHTKVPSRNLVLVANGPSSGQNGSAQAPAAQRVGIVRPQSADRGPGGFACTRLAASTWALGSVVPAGITPDVRQSAVCRADRPGATGGLSQLPANLSGVLGMLAQADKPCDNREDRSRAIVALQAADAVIARTTLARRREFTGSAVAPWPNWLTGPPGLSARPAS